MHIVIINGSPRVKKYSNTDKIIQSFANGLEEDGSTYELYSLSDRKEWDAAREAFNENDNIIIALPLYVECVPSLLLEFLDTLPTKRTKPAQLSFILHGGFDEGHQLRLGERFLRSLPAQLGCTYGGCLVKGGSFLIRTDAKIAERATKPYQAMGRLFAQRGTFITKEAAKFTGPEQFPWLLRLMVGLILKNVVNKKFEHFAQDWGCVRPLDYKAYMLNA